jgi:VWFA-related protein
VIGGVTLAALLLGQAPPVFSAGIATVRVDVSVTRKGSPVRGLQASDFAVKDNGVPQRVELVDRTSAPTTIVLVLDRSASLAGGKLATLRAAARTFLSGLRPQDEAVLVAFDHRIELLQAATTDRAAVIRGLDRLEASGASSVIDALYLGLKLRWGTGLPLVVLFTDGQDAGSWLDNEDVLRAAREAMTLLHVVGTESRGLRLARSTRGAGFSPTFGESGYVYLLRRVAETTGGAYWAVGAEKRLEATFREVLEAANERYVLRYEPWGVSPRGLHRLDVSVRPKGVDVRARREYVVPDRGATLQSPRALPAARPSISTRRAPSRRTRRTPVLGSNEKPAPDAVRESAEPSAVMRAGVKERRSTSSPWSSKAR